MLYYVYGHCTYRNILLYDAKHIKYFELLAWLAKNALHSSSYVHIRCIWRRVWVHGTGRVLLFLFLEDDERVVSGSPGHLLHLVEVLLTDMVHVPRYLLQLILRRPQVRAVDHLRQHLNHLLQLSLGPGGEGRDSSEKDPTCSEETATRVDS